MLTNLSDGLWVEAAPLSLMGLRLGTRMTIARLRGGELLLHSAIPLTPERQESVNALGELAHIVAPNLFHHMYAAQWADAYPKAVVHAPAELRKKRRDLRIDRALSEAPPDEWRGTLEPLPVDGTLLRETVFVHTPSRTLVSSDVVENHNRVDDFVTRTYLKLSGAYQKVAWPRPLRVIYRDRKAARRSIDRLLEQDFDRAILAHGDVVDTGAKDAIRNALEFVK